MPESQQLLLKLVDLKNRIADRFTQGDWRDLGALTNCLGTIEDHPRLFRSMDFGDNDYEGHILPILREMVAADPNNLSVIEKLVRKKFPEDEGGESVSSQDAPCRRIYFTPEVFKVPEEDVNIKLASAMMPFDGSFSSVYEAIQGACADAGMTCERADNVWEHPTVIQDIFSLIFRSFIVVCDFSGKNPNVFYEAGIAHTLGKHVIPITQSADDIPFDIRHHRYLKYLNNKEGRKVLHADLAKRIRTLTGWSPPSARKPRTTLPPAPPSLDEDIPF